MIVTSLVIVIVALAHCNWRAGRDVGGYARFIRSILSTGPGGR